MKNNLFRVICVLLIFFALTGCNKQLPSIPTVVIQSTTPAGEQILVAGEEINFNISVLTNHAPEGSTVGLIVQTADDTLLGITPPVEAKNGQETRLSLKTAIPVTTSVKIYAALYGDAKKDSIAVDSRGYRVVGISK